MIQRRYSPLASGDFKELDLLDEEALLRAGGSVSTSRNDVTRRQRRPPASK